MLGVANKEIGSQSHNGAIRVSGVVGESRPRAKSNRASMGTLTAADFSLQKMIEETLPVPLSVITLGNCVGVGADIFFPKPSKKPKEEFVRKNITALRLCWSCPARRDCLKYSLDNGEEHGIWGGISAEERDAYVGARKGPINLDKATDALLEADRKWRRRNSHL